VGGAYGSEGRPRSLNGSGAATRERIGRGARPMAPEASGVENQHSTGERRARPPETLGAAAPELMGGVFLGGCR
jgi:hypothetical protein